MQVVAEAGGQDPHETPLSFVVAIHPPESFSSYAESTPTTKVDSAFCFLFSLNQKKKTCQVCCKRFYCLGAKQKKEQTSLQKAVQVLTDFRSFLSKFLWWSGRVK